MDRLSGAYKRWTQLWCFAIALLLAVSLNVSTLHVARALWHQPMAVKMSGLGEGDALPTPLQALQALDELALPIGWTRLDVAAERPVDWLARIAGWIITAVATLFGAPFWFDALQRIARLKGAGPSPADKVTGTAAAR
jgi:hypothetical protein